MLSDRILQNCIKFILNKWLHLLETLYCFWPHCYTKLWSWFLCFFFWPSKVLCCIWDEWSPGYWPLPFLCVGFGPQPPGQSDVYHHDHSCWDSASSHCFCWPDHGKIIHRSTDMKCYGKLGSAVTSMKGFLPVLATKSFLQDIWAMMSNYIGFPVTDFSKNIKMVRCRYQICRSTLSSQ